MFHIFTAQTCILHTSSPLSDNTCVATNIVVANVAVTTALDVCNGPAITRSWYKEVVMAWGSVSTMGEF